MRVAFFYGRIFREGQFIPLRQAFPDAFAVWTGKTAERCPYLLLSDFPAVLYLDDN